MDEEKKMHRKLAAGIVAIVALTIGLCITTFALLYPMVSVNDNQFQMGTVRLNLNDNKPIIQEDLFEPGITVQKEFFIQNESTISVYYKLYLENVDGDLADILDMTVLDGTEVLYQGKPSDLTKKHAISTDDVLEVNERRVLTVVFHYPENAGNEGKGKSLSFDVSVDAVQTKNNPDRLFA